MTGTIIVRDVRKTIVKTVIKRELIYLMLVKHFMWMSKQWKEVY